MKIAPQKCFIVKKWLQFAVEIQAEKLCQWKNLSLAEVILLWSTRFGIQYSKVSLLFIGAVGYCTLQNLPMHHENICACLTQIAFLCWQPHIVLQGCVDPWVSKSHVARSTQICDWCWHWWWFWIYIGECHISPRYPGNQCLCTHAYIELVLALDHCRQKKDKQLNAKTISNDLYYTKKLHISQHH